MAERLNIITAVSRRENLSRIDQTLAPLRAAFDVVWYCVYDPRYTTVDQFDTAIGAIHRLGTGGSVGGQLLKNEGLSLITGGWCWILDDDNIAHPEFAAALQEAMLQYPEAQGIVFNQVLPGGQLRCWACHSNLRRDGVDQAQYVFRHTDLRFGDSYQADGYFAADLLARHGPQKIVCVNRNVTYYNFLR